MWLRLESFLEMSDKWVMANKIEIKALKKMDAIKRGKFKEIRRQRTLMQTLKDIPVTSNIASPNPVALSHL
ncbi:hypothetical protein Tco_0190332 [Tanacetum coccineum]